MTPNGFHDATTDLAVIDGWWAEWPNANIAFCPQDAGLGIIDLDGAAGKAAWDVLQIEQGQAPASYTVATPRDGLHIYYFGEVPPSQSKLGQHIDTRGRGSYALLPPSRLDGWPEPYRVIDGRTPVDMPEWVIPTLERFKKDHAKAAVADLDTPEAVARAKTLLLDYVKRGNVAVEGQMGDAKTYIVACELVNLGLSEETAVELLDTIWNPHCEPPWERDELAVKVSNAASYAQNEAGAWASPPTQETFGPILDKLGLLGTGEEGADPEDDDEFYPFTLDEIRQRPKPKWLFPNFIPEKNTVMLYGESGTYKSFIALDIALTLAAGIEGFGAGARDQCDVVYIAGEGPIELGQDRSQAWQMAREVEAPPPLRLVETMPLTVMADNITKFVARMQKAGLRPKMVVVDTLARGMAGMNENDAKDASLFIQAIEFMKRALGCAVLVIHHTGKDGARGSRGSSALPAGFDVAWEVKADKKVKEAPLLSLTCRKMKNAKEPDHPMYFEGRELADNLVFFPISPSAYKAKTAQADELNAKKIGAALVQLGAKGEDNAVATHVLAAHLVPEREGVSPEERQEMVERMAKSLRARAKAGLEAYCSGVGAGLRWSIPT